MDALIRNRKLKGGGTPRSANNDFIAKALNKVVINKLASGEVSDKDLEAVLIFSDKEGPDNGILYTYEKDGLGVGDTIVKKSFDRDRDVFYLLVEEVKRVDGSVNIRVFNVLEANVLTENDKPAYVKSNLRNKIYDTGDEGIFVETKEAVLVAPKSYHIKIADVLNLKNLVTKEESAASWRVQGIDDISSPSVIFARLNQILKNTEISNTDDGNNNSEELKVGTLKVIATENGYYETKLEGIIHKREESRIIVKVPDVDTFEIKVKQNGELINLKFKVRR